MKNQTYIRCPRCELNYILKKDKLCNVCKLEMKALGSLGVDENLDLELCPVCKINYIGSDEDMCAGCLKEKELEEGITGGKSEDEDVWTSFDSRDEESADFSQEETGDMVSITNLDETVPLDSNDEITIGLTDDEEDPIEEDEIFDGDFDETFDNLDDDDEDDYSDDDGEEDFDDDAAPKKKK